MSLSITPDVPFTLTVPVPQPNFYDTCKAQLFISTAKGKAVRTLAAEKCTKTSVTFSGTVSKTQAKNLYNCASCQSVEGRYSVIAREGSIPLDPPIKTLATGSVSLSGPPPCGECGGSDPDPDPPPPGGGSGGDNPYGPVDPGDDLVPLPPPPGSVCLPPSFVAPPPGVPTPCE
jgi:hypothetical protein